jgi:hypothetical protein
MRGAAAPDTHGWSLASEARRARELNADLVGRWPKSMNRVVAQAIRVELALCGAFQDLQRDDLGIRRSGNGYAESRTCILMRAGQDDHLFG